MSTSNVSERVVDAKGLAAMLRDRSMAWLSSRGWLDQPPPVVVQASRGPAWQSAMAWFAGGVAVATVAGYFLNAERGSLRRHMVYDRTMAPIRDVAGWSGGKARRLRNRAQGTVTEIASASERSERPSVSALS